jgi:glycosyltransferase involved in cell wall biosynthesis
MKLSVITVNLNNKAGLKNTIKSVIAQKYTDYEYIIIDGGSTDGSVDVIREYAGKIRYWVSEPDKGIYNAMNKGILQARGEYLQFLNSGDWLFDKNTYCSVFDQAVKTDIFYGNVNIVYSKSKVKKLALPQEAELSMLFFLNNTFNHQAAFISRNLFINSMYDENYKIFSDWKFFIQKIILENCSIKYLDQTIVNYDANGFSNNPAYFKLHTKEKTAILSQLLPGRILNDYKKMELVLKSPLSRELFFLSNTDRLQKLVAFVVRKLIKTYMVLMKIKQGKL